MWTHRNRHFAQQFFNADPGNPGGGGNTPPETPPETPPSKPTFDDAQQKHINDLLAKERKDAEERTARRLKDEADAAEAAAAEKRKNDEAAARGEFDAVRADLESKIGIVEGERDTLASEVETLRAYFDAEYQKAVKELPDAVLTFKPDDAASVAERTAWLTKAQEAASKLEKPVTPGNRPNPGVSTSGASTKEDELAKARLRPRL